ncbi:MAG: molybdopterin oxidoreductase family protein [Candidatus Eremiobacteraeota bacterium]|nr:molybdopterin oxidoreductase family protein [Candidatus Eremiobacteraeota bacterium]
MPVHSAICPLCEATCGLKITTENNQVVTIRGDADDPFSQGYICPKGFALKALEEDPDRLTQPLIHGQPASWKEAFELIAEKMRPLLPDVALYLGNPNVHNLAGQLYVPALARVLQGRNLFSASSLDQMPKHVASTLMFGDSMSIPVPDLERTDYLLILGANPLVSNGSLMTAPNMKRRLKKIRERGGKIVVLDPRRTLTAEAADEHHFLRPGSDAYLLLGMLHTLHAENLTRPGPHLAGVEEIAVLVADKTPEAMEPHCGIAAATIRRLARELAAAPSAAVYGRLGTCTQEFGTLVSWLIEVVNALTGNLDRPGGAMFPKAAAGAKNTAPKGRLPRPGQLRTRVRSLPQINGEFPTAALAEEILTPGEGRIRGLITIAGNPALSAPDSDQMEKALEQVEFMVSVDCYLNETTRHADVLLPVPGHLQRSHYDIVFAQLAVHNYARYSPPVFDLEPGQWDEWQIILELARILSGQPVTLEQMDQMVAGQLQQRYQISPPLPDLRGPERLLDLMLRGGPYGLTLAEVKEAPIDLGPLQPRLPELLRTASEKVELAPPELVQDLQRLRPEPPTEFVLIGRRELRSNNSWMHNLPLLVKGPSPCTLLLHPADAEKLGLQPGDLACVSSPQASLELPVEVSDTIMPGVVSIPHGWGHRQTGQRVAVRHAGVNANRLLGSTRLDPLSGNAVQNGVPVQVRKVQ